jgi:hypothetical protein
LVTQDLDHPARAAGDGDSCTPSDLFDLLWATLDEILGSPTTATLMRRSIRQRLGEYGELNELAITRTGFEYAYTVPETWKHANEPSTAALQAVLQTLCSLLVELSGPIVVRRLKELPQLTKCGLVVSETEV